MRLSSLLLLTIGASCCVCAVPHSTIVEVTPQDEILTSKVSRNISIVGDDFVIDGQRLQIVSGSLHYFRLPAAFWRDRLRKLKAAGLNSVSTYVEWSHHEPEERQYRFEGDYDVAEFVRIAAEEGLHVLLRPGPYICAERDLGGFPYWLLGKYPNIRLRSTDKNYMAETRIWFNKLFSFLTPLLYGNGGPIILVQVENEYGSYGSDKKYLNELRDVMLPHVGSNALLYTTDGPTPAFYGNVMIEGTLTTIDFGVGHNVPQTFQKLRQYMPHGPFMNSEFYPGWLTHWGENLQKVDTNRIVTTMKDMLNYNCSFNFYMFFGGTNFGFTAGANYGDRYEPDITSYDYDAPLSEAGDPTNKYFAIREALETYFPEVKNIPLPIMSQKGSYGKVKVSPVVQLMSAEGRKSLGKKYDDYTGIRLPTFEKLRQMSGLVLYETTVKGTGKTVLKIKRPKDRVYVFVDDVLKGTLSRTAKSTEVPIEVGDSTKLSLLVENQGRINFGPKLHDFKGILSPVQIGDSFFHSRWRITGYPLERIEVSPQHDVQPQGPVLFEGNMTLPANVDVLDTYLNTAGWGKGYVWVNGQALGRYWPDVGPQVTLYVPRVWLKPSPQVNHIKILELEVPSVDLTLEFIDHPIFLP